MMPESVLADFSFFLFFDGFDFTYSYVHYNIRYYLFFMTGS